MKRIRYACLEQTIHFQLKDDLPHDEAVRLVRREVENYRHGLERKGVKHRIVSEEAQEDGSIVIMIRKQYNEHAVGDYLDA